MNLRSPWGHLAAVGRICSPMPILNNRNPCSCRCMKNLGLKGCGWSCRAGAGAGNSQLSLVSQLLSAYSTNVWVASPFWCFGPQNVDVELQKEIRECHSAFDSILFLQSNFWRKILGLSNLASLINKQCRLAILKFPWAQKKKNPIMGTSHMSPTNMLLYLHNSESAKEKGNWQQPFPTPFYRLVYHFMHQLLKKVSYHLLVHCPNAYHSRGWSIRIQTLYHGTQIFPIKRLTNIRHEMLNLDTQIASSLKANFGQINSSQNRNL